MGTKGSGRKPNHVYTREEIELHYIQENHTDKWMTETYGTGFSTFYAACEKYGIVKSPEMKEQARLDALHQGFAKRDEVAAAQKRKEYYQKNYGVDNVFQTKHAKEAYKKTMQELYGVDHYSQTSEYREKYVATSLERYGVDNPNKSNEVRKKIVATNLEKYGVENAMQNDDIKQKAIQTNLEKYGNACPIQGSLKEQVRQTFLDKYGVDNPFAADEVKEKIKQANIEKYGTEIANQSRLIRDRVKTRTLTKKYIKMQYSEEDAVQKAQEFFNDDFVKEYLKTHSMEELVTEYHLSRYDMELRCVDLDIEFPADVFAKWYSGELACKIALEALNVKYEFQKKFPDCRNIFELPFDFYLPEYNTCIEFDGRQHYEVVDVWGGEEALRDRQYWDAYKDSYCELKGIRMLRIPYWDEANVKTIIAEFLGISCL